MSSVVKWCGAMGWDLMSLWCDVAGCDVTLRGSKWSCGVNWKMTWWSVLHRSTPYYTVLQSTTPVLFCTTQYYSSTTPYYKIPLQYYSVLQSTTPVLRCTTQYYSNTILYYEVLLQYYSVLKVLLQYYSVLQSTTPVLLCTTKYYSSPSLYYKVLLQYYSVLQSTHLQCAEQQDSSSNITKCCACHAKWLASSILVTCKTSFTMRGGTGITRQPHQMLRLPRKMTLMIDLRHIWNVNYNARSNRHHPPTSPNTAPATQNDSHDWCPSHMTRHLQCAEQQISSSNITKCCACHAKWLASSILLTYETYWNVIYNARRNRHHPPTSPNTAPATQNDSHAWSSSHMERHLQCAEQQASPSNLTKYCACHAKVHSKI